MNPPLNVLWVGPAAAALPAAPFGPFDLHACASLDEAAQALRERSHDALLWHCGTDPMALGRWQALSHAVLETAVLVVAPVLDPEFVLDWIRRGVQDVLPAESADADTIARVLRLAVERKRLELAARKAYATDLSTGLPSHAQLLEHMSHLLALREREPAPMAVLVLRIEGLATAEAALGAEAANVLRRKAAVRLRAGLRASDVVASIGTDSFAVLLGWIDSAGDGERVAGKLAVALRQTFKVAGQDQALAVSVGVGQYPQHGERADELLRHAIGQATLGDAAGRTGFANRVERGGTAAANDETPA